MGALGRDSVAFGENIRGLKAVRVKKTDLLDKVKANRETHKKSYDEAVIGYRAQCITDLREALAKAVENHADFRHALTVSLHAPSNHTDDYDRVIDMLTMSLDDEVDLPMHEFTRYVRDEWDWSTQFQHSVSSYTGKR